MFSYEESTNVFIIFILKIISSEFIYLINNFDQVNKIVNQKEYYVIQEEIMPLLHFGKKMDERCYIFVVKENNTFTSYFLPYFYLKFTRDNFTTDGLIAIVWPASLSTKNFSID